MEKAKITLKPVFECIVYGIKRRLDYEISCAGDVKRTVENVLWCCGQQMVEIIDD